jgi:hypothetical protein
MQVRRHIDPALFLDVMDEPGQQVVVGVSSQQNTQSQKGEEKL